MLWVRWRRVRRSGVVVVGFSEQVFIFDRVVVCYVVVVVIIELFERVETLVELLDQGSLGEEVVLRRLSARLDLDG